MLVPSFVMIGPFHARHKSLHNTRNHCDLGKPALSQRKAQLCHASPEKPEKMKMNVGLFLMIIGIHSVVVEAQTSALLSSFDWEDCDTTGTAVITVNKLNVTSPLPIPGQVEISMEANITSDIPCDAVLKFNISATTGVGNPGAHLTIPCVEGQGSCAYLLSDMLSATSSVTQQLIRVLMPASKCPLKAGVVTVPPVNITIPDMHTSILDALINTNNYFVIAQLNSPDGQSVLGCLNLTMPVKKLCLGWLCPHDLDYVIQFWNPTTTRRP
ncbi:ganglioside GM2 activator-like [Pomacea canaliculata]|uniref:ganglioside GM2 activator-like n=1 Tax=Pomacea canaliculata TaxID=400727 RepID=UPI000D73C3B8|nr:ganglioside GM2 activator-like [Pomacea canaliculata]